MKTLRRRLSVPYAAAIFVAAIGTLVTIGAFLLVSSWEYRVADIDFQSRAKSYIEAINNELGDASTLLYSIAAHISTDDRPVSAQEFGEFSAILHRRVSGLRDTAWAPRVTLAERTKFERDARAAGLENYQIVEIGRGGKVVRATARPEYYALLYFEAGGAKRAVLGRDQISEKVRAKAVRLTLLTGRPAATPPMDVVTVPWPGAGVLSYMAVYPSRHGARLRGAPPRGVVLGVFDIHDLVEKFLARRTSMSGLNLLLFNAAARPSRRVVYQTQPPSAAEPPATEADLLAGAHRRSTVLMIDQPLGVIVTPVVPLRFLRPTLSAVVTLLAGLAVTAMNVAYIVVSQRRTRELTELSASLQETTQKLHRTNEQITRVSLHDALTGMPNRLLFQERMQSAIARAARGSSFALLFLDLDRFKVVNDTLGHGAGDRLLCMVSERIRSSIREVDTAVRLGGDEFAIIVADVAERATIELLAGRLIANISRPYAIDDQPAVIGVSIGAAFSRPGATIATIVAEADLAMYDAKDAGRGTLRVFEERLRTRIDQKRLFENDLRFALERNELEVHYQPLIDLAQNRVAAFEALVRWKHPQRGMIPPDRFIPVAEECGLIDELGLWVLETACRDAVAWPQPVKVAVNVSPIQLKDAALLEKMLMSLTRSGLSPGRLEIELTEAAVLQPGGKTLGVLRQLHALGVTVAFDDFGTGYSSLSSLQRFPFDKIKIDRSFLDEVDTSPRAAALVRGVVALATNLNLRTTGEGVETPAQLEHLRSCGCTEAQGYLFSPARPNADVPDLLRLLDASAATASSTHQLAS